MSKFNKAKTLPKVASANGNMQFLKSAKQQLLELVLNTLYGRDSFYESTDDKAKRTKQLIKQLVAENELDFIANLLVFARAEMSIRNMPILGTLYFLDELRTQGVRFPGARTLVSSVVQRVDQITDLLALIETKAKMPMALKRGLSDAFNKFNEYQFAKYNRKGKVSLKDAMRVIHPVPKDEDTSALFDKIMKDTLATPDTWETQLSAHGNHACVWEGLIERNALGYQAMLKNLRNMEKVSSQHKLLVADRLVSGAVKSKSLPFEFLVAMEALENSESMILRNGVISAMDQSVANVPSLGNKVLVILDTSGSMEFDNARASKTACFLTAVLAKANVNADNFTVINFASDARIQRINTVDSVFSIYSDLLRDRASGSTNFEAALGLANSLKKQFDAVIVLTDNEIDSFQHTRSVANFQSRATRVVINCASSTSTVLPSFQGWHQLAGWSTNMFKYLKLSNDSESMLEMLSKPF